MTSHRDSTDAQFATHLATLDETTLDNKITAWEALQVSLDTEKGTVHGQRGQLVKHKKKVSEMIDDLQALKAYSTGTEIPALQSDVSNASFANLASISNHVFDIGSYKRGFVKISLSNIAAKNEWFDICLKTSIVDATNSNAFFYVDMLVVPADSTFPSFSKNVPGSILEVHPS